VAKTFWFTGLSASGKTTLAAALVGSILHRGHRAEILDGDTMRALTGTLGFSREHRRHNVLSAAFTAKLLNRNDVWVAAAFVSPHREARDEAREIVGPGFVEVYVDCPVEKCMERDPKGLYKRKVPGMTGVDDSYEAPSNPDIVLKTAERTVESCLNTLLEWVR